MNKQEVRKYLRHKPKDTFVINKDGVCQVLDLSSKGVSFGCTKERTFPETWTVDIVNNTGIHIWDLPIKTVWAEKNNTYPSSSIHPVKMGAKFDEKLTSEHLSALTELLEFLRAEAP